MKNEKVQLVVFGLITLIFMVGISFLGMDASASEEQTVEEEVTQSEKLLDDSKETISTKLDTRVGQGFNWRLLDTDGIDLSTFKKVTVNTPVKLTGGVFDKQQREYYMFFGHVGYGNRYDHTTGTFYANWNVLAPLNEESDTVVGTKNTLPITGPGMIGVKKGTATKQQLFGYDYNYLLAGAGAGRSNSSFDIGELDQSGHIAASGYTPLNTSIAREQIMEQYVKDNEIVSYGYFYQKSTTTPVTYTKLPVRVHGHVVDFKRGRIRYDLSFYNESGQQKSYALNHSSHMDVGGNHTSSRLFSYEKAGLYLNEPTSTKADGLPARIYFYTNAGYPEGSNMPTEYLVGNLKEGSSKEGAKIGFFINMNNAGFNSEPGGLDNPNLPWGNNYLPMNQEYNLTHPIFLFRWPNITVPSGGVGTALLDMSIEEPLLLKPMAQKTYKNTMSTNGDNLIGDILDFTVTASNEGDISPWQQVTLEDQLPAELELDRNSMVLVDATGKESKLPASIYNPTTRTFTVGKYDLEAKKAISINYKAKIVGGAHTTVVNRFKAYNDKAEADEDVANISIKGKPAEPKALKTYTNSSSTDGKNRVGEVLSFELTASNTGEAIWNDIVWTDSYPAELEIDKSSFVLVDPNGVTKKITPIFNANSPSFTVLNTAFNINSGEKSMLRYKAKIISGEGTTIVNQFKAYSFSDATKKAEAQVSIPIVPKKALTKELTIGFVDKSGKKLADPIIRTKEIGDIVNLKAEADTVNSELYNTIDKIEAQQYMLVQRPSNEAAVNIVEGENKVTYIFDGTLVFYSAPNTINFSTHKFDGKTTRVNEPAYDQDLVVKDGRLVKEKWTLTAKLTSEMTHTDQKDKAIVLKNAIRYVYEGKEFILDKEAQPIIHHVNDTDNELYNISNTWVGTKVGDGFKLEIDPGEVKKLGFYQGEILWELAATPDP